MQERTNTEGPREEEETVVDAYFEPLAPRVMIDAVGKDHCKRDYAVDDTAGVIHPIIETPVGVGDYGCITRCRRGSRRGRGRRRCHRGRRNCGST